MYRSAVRMSALALCRQSSSQSFASNLTRHLSSITSSPSATLLQPSHLSPLAFSTGVRHFSDEALEKNFQKAVANLQKVQGDLDNDMKLKIYALYKQATNGPCSGEKPSVFNAVAKAKYQAWKALGEMGEDDARKEYIDLVKELLEKSENVTVEETKAEPQLVFEEKDKVYWIRLNRPNKFNALTPEMYEGIIDALKRAAEDEDIKFVAIKGTGQYFSSGNDLKNFMVGLEKHNGDMEAATAEAREMLSRFVAAFIDFPKPIIGVANGPVFGILFTTMAMYDVVFASDTAIFTCPFTKIGQTPEGCSTYNFPRIFGPSLASQLLYFNYTMSVKEAKDAGFVHEIVPKDKLDQRVDEWLYGKDGKGGKVDECFPNALMNAKALVMNEEYRMNLHEVNKNECDVIQQQWKSEELMEALQKFASRK